MATARSLVNQSQKRPTLKLTRTPMEREAELRRQYLMATVRMENLLDLRAQPYDVNPITERDLKSGRLADYIRDLAAHVKRLEGILRIREQHYQEFLGPHEPLAHQQNRIRLEILLKETQEMLDDYNFIHENLVSSPEEQVYVDPLRPMAPLPLLPLLKTWTSPAQIYDLIRTLFSQEAYWQEDLISLLIEGSNYPLTLTAEQKLSNRHKAVSGLNHLLLIFCEETFSRPHYSEIIAKEVVPIYIRYLYQNLHILDMALETALLEVIPEGHQAYWMVYGEFNKINDRRATYLNALFYSAILRGCRIEVNPKATGKEGKFRPPKKSLLNLRRTTHPDYNSRYRTMSMKPHTLNVYSRVMNIANVRYNYPVNNPHLFFGVDLEPYLTLTESLMLYQKLVPRPFEVYSAPYVEITFAEIAIPSILDDQLTYPNRKMVDFFLISMEFFNLSLMMLSFDKIPSRIVECVRLKIIDPIIPMDSIYVQWFDQLVEEHRRPQPAIEQLYEDGLITDQQRDDRYTQIQLEARPKFLALFIELTHKYIQ